MALFDIENLINNFSELSITNNNGDKYKICDLYLNIKRNII